MSNPEQHREDSESLDTTPRQHSEQTAIEVPVAHPIHAPAEATSTKPHQSGPETVTYAAANRTPGIVERGLNGIASFFDGVESLVSPVVAPIGRALGTALWYTIGVPVRFVFRRATDLAFGASIAATLVGTGIATAYIVGLLGLVSSASILFPIAAIAVGGAALLTVVAGGTIAYQLTKQAVKWSFTREWNDKVHSPTGGAYLDKHRDELDWTEAP